MKTLSAYAWGRWLKPVIAIGAIACGEGPAGMGDVDSGHIAGDSGLHDSGSFCIFGDAASCDCGQGLDSGTQTCDGIKFGECICNDPEEVTTLYVHGRGDAMPTDWSYWTQGPRPGFDAVAVNWDASERIGGTNITVREAFDTYCSGNDWCYVACHSAGCAQVGYALDHYGTTSGIATWNILWVAAAGSAAGGSELANLKLWSTDYPIDEDLKTAVMRNLYNHDNTSGTQHYMFAGAGYSDSHPGYAPLGARLPGDDDLAVAYHSACGVNNTAYNDEDSWCNPSEPCFTGNNIELDTPPYLWTLHSVWFLDEAQEYSHFVSDQNEGICHEMFSFMEDNAL